MMPEKNPSSSPKRTFLLRCWRESEDSEWRYSLQAADGRTPSRHGFTRLEDIITFLQTELENKDAA